ncbi:MAG: PDZ domain-containing protein [Asgard group archaeon]|nr:PDZ domain-containing protein [Asgard group archaeon]
MLSKLEQMIIDVVEDVMPSVVSVSTTVLARVDLFSLKPIQGVGSGIIVDEKGVILTNSHVIRGAQEIKIHLQDGRDFNANLLGQLSEQDIAILQIEGVTDLKAIKIGNSSDLKVGQFAIAIGNPLGLGKSVTFGLISAINRTISTERVQLEGLIQTTADINPGNSGGALVNTSGELIGVPTAVIQYSQGLGFAIAVDVIKGALEQYKETGTLSSPWLGIIGYTIDKNFAEANKLAVSKGALIIEVPNGPAKNAGIIAGDIITKIDEDIVESIQTLTRHITRHKVGDEVKIKLFRNGKSEEINVKLGKAPDK